MAKVALLIGVSEYEPGLTPLPAALRDVEAMRQVLQDSKLGEFAQTDVTVLENPDRTEMEEAIYALFNERHRDDLVLLYFSGHGILDYKKNRLYLAAHKTRMTVGGSLMPVTAVPASFVHECMSLSRSRRVVILDSCFSGAFAEGLVPKDVGAVDVGAHLGSKDWAVLTSSTSLQYSFEQQGSDLSIYTHHLVEGIRTGAADQDGDGFVAIGELHEYASGKVRESQEGMKPEIYTLREGFKIRLSKAPPLPSYIRYHRELNRFINQDGVPSITPRILKLLRSRIPNLSNAEAITVEDEVLASFWPPLQERLQQYEHVLTELLQKTPPLSDLDQAELKQTQELLYLRDEDVESLRSDLLQNWQKTQIPPVEVPPPLPSPELDQTHESKTGSDEVVQAVSINSVVAPPLPNERFQAVLGSLRSLWLQLQWPSLKLFQPPRWLLLGTGAAVLGSSMIGTNNFLQLQIEQNDRQKLAQLQALNAATKYGDCITQANVVSPNSHFFQQTQNLLNQCRLSQANAFAKAGKLKEAVSLVSQIPDNASNYAAAQTALNQWSDSLLQLATKEYQAGKKDDADSILNAIPVSSTVGKKAQQTSNHWQKEWNINQKYFKDAQSALNAKQWKIALDIAKKVTAPPALQQQAKKIIEQSEAELEPPTPPNSTDMVSPSTVREAAPVAQPAPSQRVPANPVLPPPTPESWSSKG